jgi:phage shock protein A
MGYDDSVVELAGKIVDLVKADDALIAKAGARNSKNDMARLQGIHDHAVSLGAGCDEAVAAKAAELGTENERLAKALSEAAPQIEEIAKAFQESQDLLKSELAEVRKRLEQVESEPAASKTATTLTPITKGQDTNPDRGAEQASSPMSGEDFRKAFDALPEEEKGIILLKVALNNPTLIKQPARAAV